MTKIKIYVWIMLIAISVMFLGVSFTIKDQYDEKLHKQDKEISKLKVENKKLQSTNKQMGITIDELYEEVQGKRATECDCGWYMDFYYEHAEELGAYE